MIRSAIRLVLLLSCVLAVCQGKGQDATLKAGGSGTKVVDAVLNRIHSKCIYPEDRLFLRRLARVKSQDGTASHTYRPGFDGGIWQLTESMFNETQACNNGLLREACRYITSGLNIEWIKVKYSELRKPLYSGLGAALFTLLTLNRNIMPGNITEQATYSARMYNESKDIFLDNSALPDVRCNDKLDLAFILDSSGSVRESDFDLMLNFTANVIGHLNMSRDNVRVADIVYSSNGRVYFDFNGYQNKSHAQQLVMSTPKEDRGTNTALGLDLATGILFNPSRGARNDSKKVAILITDGQSNSFSKTKRSAAELKTKGATVFAVGVGNYRKSELDVVASDPICSHVLTLTSFGHIKSLLTEILKITCEANFKMAESQTVGGNITEKGTETTVETPLPSQNETIEASVSCGILNIYVSSSDPKPSKAVHDSSYVSAPGLPAYITFPQTLSSGSKVYVTLVGTRLPHSAALARQCSDYSWSLAKVAKKNISVICTENGVPRPCTKQHVVGAGLCKNDDSDFPFDNPCTTENLNNGVMRHPYLYDGTKFLQCDMKGRAYVTQCPGGISFNTETRECGFTSPPLGGNSPQENNADRTNRTSQGATALAPLPNTLNNPCNARALARNMFYHEYTPDNTSYVQCDLWGRAWVKPCAPSTVWSQDAYSCVPKPPDCAVSCKDKTTVFKAHPCNVHAFFMCSNGVPIKMDCPSSLRFDPNLQMCTY